eukprot:IDg7554t1
MKCPMGYNAEIPRVALIWGLELAANPFLASDSLRERDSVAHALWSTIGHRKLVPTATLQKTEHMRYQRRIPSRITKRARPRLTLSPRAISPTPNPTVSAISHQQ